MRNFTKQKLSDALMYLFLTSIIFFTKEVNAQDYYLDFNKGDRVETGTTVSELDGATTFTFETKIYLETLPAWTNILSKAVSNTDRISLQLNAGQLFCIVADGTNSFRRTPGAPLMINTWYHLAMVYDGSLSGFDKLKLYIDGVEQTDLEDSGAVTLPTTTPSNTADFRLAMAWNYEGGIDEVRVWNSAITSANINAWKNKQLDKTHPNYANLKLYWNLDDFDTPVVASGTEGTSYNGTIVGATYVSHIVLGTEDIELEETLSNVFPNPFTEVVSFVLQVENSFTAKVMIYNAVGNLVWQRENFPTNGLHKIAIDCGKLSSGTYILKVSDGERTYAKKLIKN